MKLSTRVRYGLRLMVVLAENYDQGSVNLREIALKEDISEKYLGNIVVSLKTHQLITSNRGSGGGFTLSKKPSEIKLSDIFGAIEGNLNLIECLGNKDTCGRVKICSTRPIWEELNNKMKECLSSITLTDVLEKKYNYNDSSVQYI